ncbi:hypothetical protein HK405_011330 [Cladochytrium tenue]|nr:hypothetical protein HK405_011330 [Cladochytrium tenue]
MFDDEAASAVAADFDGGRSDGEDDPDLAAEARLFRDPTSKRRRFTKEDAIYGVFADDDGDSDGSGFRGGRRLGARSGRAGRVPKEGIRFVRGSASGAAADADAPPATGGATEAIREAMHTTGGDFSGSGSGDDGNDDDDNMDVDLEGSVEGTADPVQGISGEGTRRPLSRARSEPNDEDDDMGGASHAGLGFSAGAGLGFIPNQSTSHAGLGFASAGLSSKAGLGAARSGLGFSDASSSPRAGLGSGGSSRPGLGSSNTSSSLPTSFGRQKETKPAAPPSNLGAQESKTQVKPQKVDPEFAKFEMLGKGIGLKYMMKMGYKIGEGLGKGGGGIVEPIDVKLRPNKMGLGHNGFDETTKTQKKLKAKNRTDYVLSDDSDKEAGSKGTDRKVKQQEKPVVMDSWKKSKKGRKVQYRTATDVLREQDQLLAAEATTQKVKIIDMTGKDARELADMSEAASATQIASLRSSASHLLELRYNVRMLVGESETELVRLTKALALERSAQDKAADEERLMAQRAQELRERRARLATAVDVVRRVAGSAKQLLVVGSADLEVALVQRALHPDLDLLRSDHLPEFREYHLDAAVAAGLSPVLKRLLSTWEPLEDPEFALEVLKPWKALLRAPVVPQGVGRNEPARSMTPFESMLYEIWLPKVRQAVNNTWSPKHPDTVILLLEAWYPTKPPPELIMVGRCPELRDSDAPQVIPPWLHHNILTQLIIPKLRVEIDRWDYRKDGVLPHTWLFPWLPVLNEEFESLYEPIRLKLMASLSDWHPRDPDRALALVRPWADALPPKDFSAVLNRAVLPKLVALLRHEFAVNPAAQDDAPLRWALAWTSVLSDATLSHLLETEFFPKWVHVLYVWLAAPTAALEDVGRWYAAWKTFFPPAVAAWPGVADAFRVGLDLMQRRVAGAPLGDEPRIVPVAERETTAAAKQPAAPRAQEEAAAAGRDPRAGLPELLRRKAVDSGFQDLLERTADAHGLAVVPAVAAAGARPPRAPAAGRPVLRLVDGGDAARTAAGLLFYVDDGVVHVYEGGAVGDSLGTWTPVGVDEAMARARRAVGTKVKKGRAPRQ